MASPFTAKAASVAPVTDILKQGRYVTMGFALIFGVQYNIGVQYNFTFHMCLCLYTPMQQKSQEGN